MRVENEILSVCSRIFAPADSPLIHWVMVRLLLLSPWLGRWRYTWGFRTLFCFRKKNCFLFVKKQDGILDHLETHACETWSHRWNNGTTVCEVWTRPATDVRRPCTAVPNLIVSFLSSRFSLKRNSKFPQATNYFTIWVPCAFSQKDKC